LKAIYCTIAETQTMKLTTRELSAIIAEELRSVLEEGWFGSYRSPRQKAILVKLNKLIAGEETEDEAEEAAVDKGHDQHMHGGGWHPGEDAYPSWYAEPIEWGWEDGVDPLKVWLKKMGYENEEDEDEEEEGDEEWEGKPGERPRSAPEEAEVLEEDASPCFLDNLERLFSTENPDNWTQAADVILSLADEQPECKDTWANLLFNAIFNALDMQKALWDEHDGHSAEHDAWINASDAVSDALDELKGIERKEEEEWSHDPDIPFQEGKNSGEIRTMKLIMENWKKFLNESSEEEQKMINSTIMKNPIDIETIEQMIELAKAMGLDYSAALHTNWATDILLDKDSAPEKLNEIFDAVPKPIDSLYYSWPYKLLNHPNISGELVAKIADESNYQNQNIPPSVSMAIKSLKGNKLQ